MDAPHFYWRGDKGLRGCLARMFGKMRRFDAADGEQRRSPTPELFQAPRINFSQAAIAYRL
jgi:hypothetical protein